MLLGNSLLRTIPLPNPALGSAVNCTAYIVTFTGSSIFHFVTIFKITPRPIKITINCVNADRHKMPESRSLRENAKTNCEYAYDSHEAFQLLDRNTKCSQYESREDNAYCHQWGVLAALAWAGHCAGETAMIVVCIHQSLK
jgi:hypothetical protein